MEVVEETTSKEAALLVSVAQLNLLQPFYKHATTFAALDARGVERNSPDLLIIRKLIDVAQDKG